MTADVDGNVIEQTVTVCVMDVRMSATMLSTSHVPHVSEYNVGVGDKNIMGHSPGSITGAL